MQTVCRIQVDSHTKEESLPCFSPDFPYLFSCAYVDRYPGGVAPWHWHKAVELFYMESGTLEYFTPHGQKIFAAGAGGFLNSNVLHMTRPVPGSGRIVQLLHIFEPSLVAGAPGSRIEQKYVLPVLASPAFDLVAFDPANPAQAEILAQIRAAFALPEQQPGYELRLREALSRIWLALLAQVPQPAGLHRADDGKIKQMMTYIYERYPEKISVRALAAAAYLSERECYRVFRETLHTTPVEYLKNYRVQMACRLLRETQRSVSEIGYACGLGSSSYFGKVFREVTGSTPTDYRAKWQDRDIIGR